MMTDNKEKSLKYYKSSDSRSSFISRLLNGHLPPRELLNLINRTFRRNLYFRRLFRLEERARYNGLAVFIARHNTIELGLLDKICNLIKLYGFEIICVEPIGPKERQRLIDSTPIHKWAGISTGRGHPEVCIAVFDPKPIYLYYQRTKMWLKFYPYLDNLRLVFKHSIRSSITKTLEKRQRSCFVHATDNSNEALQYIRISIPEKLDDIKNWIDAKRL